MSSANILFETSKAKTISTPSLLTVSILEPIFGLINAIIRQASASKYKVNFKTGLNLLLSGASFLSAVGFPNLCCARFIHHLVNRKSRITAGIIQNNQKYVFSSNTIIYTKLLNKV